MAASVRWVLSRLVRASGCGCVCVCLGTCSAAWPTRPFFISFITTPQPATTKVGQERKGVEKRPWGGADGAGEPDIGSLLHSSSLLCREKGEWFGPECEV